MHCQGCTAAAKQEGHCPAVQPQDSLPIKEAGTSSMPCIAEAEEARQALNYQSQASNLSPQVLTPD